MAVLKKINTKARSEINTGFGVNTSDYGGRFINKDGSAKIEKKGISLLGRVNWYHTLLKLPRWKFFSLIIAFSLLINLVFATIYCAIGIQHLNGIQTDGSFW